MKKLLEGLKENGCKPFDSEWEAVDFILGCYKKIAKYVLAVYR